MQPNRAIMNDQRQNDRDREFFSELIEPPIHLHFIQVVPPFLEESNPVYVIQISGEVAWKCREFYWMPRRVFDSLQASILPLGYKLNESSCDRVGRPVGENIRRFKRKMDSITSGKQRQKVRAETWVKITINPEEIALTPSDVLAKVTKKNNDLSTTVEEKIAELYNSEGQRLAQNGKHFTEVGKKQQNRQLTEIR